MFSHSISRIYINDHVHSKMHSISDATAAPCLVGYPRCFTTWAVVIGVVKYSPTARWRSSGLNIR